MRKIVLVTWLFLGFACSEQPEVSLEQAETDLQVDTLAAVDSIGVLMGDSCYVLGLIADCTMLADGRPAILDRLKGTISVYDPHGIFQFCAGGTGEGPGEFQYPLCLAQLRSGIIVVAEMMGEVTALDQAGRYIDGWTFQGMGGLPIDCIPFDDSTFVGYYFSMKIEESSVSINYSLRRYHVLTGEIVAEYFNWSGEPDPSTDFTPGYLVAAGDGRGTLYVSRIQNEKWLIEVYGSEPEPVDSILLFPERERVALPDSGGFVPGCLPVQYGFQDNGAMMQEMVNMPEEHPFISQLGVHLLKNS